ncbi:MAG: hypothetical protein QM767_18385 [Anaeromyxobacter sp.]
MTSRRTAAALAGVAVALALLPGAAAAGDPAGGNEALPCTGSAACAASLGQGNVCIDGRCQPYADRRDIFNVLGLKQGAPQAPETLVPLVAGVPAIGYSPSSGVLFGLAGTAGMLLGDGRDTTISSATATLLYTTKNQVIVQLAATALLPGNTWELLADWRYLIFNQDTYGLGTSSTPLQDGITLNGWGDLAEVDGAQPMDFDLLRFHQSALRRVKGSVYLGAGYRLDRYTHVVDHRLDPAATPAVLTSHYAYSLMKGFDPAGYTASGLSLEAVSDSRDSTIAAYRGWYGHLRFTGYPTWLGSDRSATLVSVEGRWYLGLRAEDPRNVLAFWAMASGVTSGRLPYLALPSSGWDARSTSGRGYVQGRFRGTSMAYGEVEWRFRITDDGLWGGTLFSSLQSYARPAVELPEYGYSERGEKLFDAVRVAAGGGLRLMLLRQSRTALRLDLAAGQRSLGFYLGAGEAF